MTYPAFITSPLLQPIHGFGTIAAGLPPLPAVTERLAKKYPLVPPSCLAPIGGKAVWQLDKRPVQAMKQVHGTYVRMIGEGDALLDPFSEEGDGIVTDRTDIIPVIVTADCAPLLLSGKNARGCNIVGAVHAGWRGAVSGVIESGIEAMKTFGAQEIFAAIGPCITSFSYEISEEMREEIYLYDKEASPWLHKGKSERKFYFDLPGYCFQRLVRQGVGRISVSGFDTCSDSHFWSYRRESLNGNTALAIAGRQFSFIRA